MSITGTSGNDTLTGTSGNDVFTMTQGGTDTVSGLGGDDVFNFGAAFNVGDSVSGGDGIDTLKLDGDYSGSSQLVFTATTMTGVEKLLLAGGHSYGLTMDDGNVAAGQTLSINASALGASDVLNFNGGFEQDGGFSVTGGAGADIIDGGHGDDHISAGDGADSINGGLGGHDVLAGDGGADFITVNGGTAVVQGGAGNDIITVNAAYGSADHFDGGDGNDLLLLAHGGTIKFGATSLTSIETINLAAGQTYALTTNDANVAAGGTLFVAGSNVAGGFTFDGRAELDGSFSITGGAGNDTLYGGRGADVIDPGAGTDHVQGGNGNDLILMGANLDASDRIDGNDGALDEVQLSGDYSAGIVLQPDTLEYIDLLFLGGGHSYKITTNEETVEDGRTMTIDASQVGAGNSLTFNAIHETDSSYAITAGQGAATIVGGAMADTILLGNGNTLSAGGVDSIKAEAGNDTITITNFFDVHSRIDGGDGNDVVNFEAGSDTPYSFTATTLLNVETFNIKNVTFASITVKDQAVAAGQTLTVDGSTETGAVGGVTNHFTFDGSAETDGAFVMKGGDGNDTLIGGAGADSLAGGLGADSITGNGGADVFVYHTAAESNGSFVDTIAGFDALADKFDLPFAVTGVDATVASGSASAASFNTDLAAALGSGHLAAGHAVLFTPTSGTLAGDTFLVVDANGTAGYQANVDMVFQLTGAVHLASLGTGDFI